MSDVKVSIGIEFLNAYSKIAHSEQKRVREFIEKFWENPRSSAINYEKIHDMKDRNVRTVRINDAYRAIVLNPESGNNFVLAWVDHHDEAMRWAKNKKFDINKYTGAIEILDYEFVERIEAEEKKWTFSQKPIFHNVTDDELLTLGIPEVFMTTVKNIDSELALDQFAKYLPGEVSEALYFLASGYTFEQTLNELTSSSSKLKGSLSDIVKSSSNYESINSKVTLSVLTSLSTADNFAISLENDNSKRRFRCVDDAKELSAILDAPLEQWRVFLHPIQRALVEINSKGPVLVLGGAGTGKTVVAMHRAKYLAEKVFTAPGDKILFTTFSKSLAADIKNCLSSICDEESLKRIEVTNIDHWMTVFLKRNGFNFQIASETEVKSFWGDALKLAPSTEHFKESFYRDEWRIVIQPNAVCNLNDYLKVSRMGSSRNINRETRINIWPVFERLRKLFYDSGKVEFIDLFRETISFIEKNPELSFYRSVIVDEGQDMSTEAFRLIRQIVPENNNDLFILGDCHQKIYAHKVMLSGCGINISSQRTMHLKLNYRTTDEIRRWASKLFDSVQVDDLNGGIDVQEGYRSLLHGAYPEVREFASESDELNFLAGQCKNLISSRVLPESICVVARTNDIINRYKEHFSNSGLPTFLISRDASDIPSCKGIRFATMHRVKGLEFDHVLIAAVNKDVLPLKRVMDDIDNDTAFEEADLRERSLLYVAVTRAKKSVTITCSGEMSGYLKFIKSLDG